MMAAYPIGIIGGTGQLGGGVARGLLRTQFIAPEQLRISSRSGDTSTIEKGLNVRFTLRDEELVNACPTVILSVPPQIVPTLNINASDRLVISVMAGTPIHEPGRQILKQG